MKKTIFFLGLLCFFIPCIFSQVQVDPNDDFYTYAQNWELRGLTNDLPQLRPYSLNVVQDIIDCVIENGTEKDIEIAKSEYERIFSRPWHVYAYGDGILKISHEEGNGAGDGSEHETNELKKAIIQQKTAIKNSLLGKTQEQIDRETYRKTSKEKNVTGEVGVEGDIRFHPLVSLGYRLGTYVEKKDYDDFAPYAVNKKQDSVFDPAKLGPLTSYLDWNTNISVGKSNLYAMAGISRIGYGPFYGDGPALNDTSYHSANLTFNYTGKKFSYASSFEIIGATDNTGQTDNHWLNSGKYLAFHSIKYHLFKNLDVSYYENVIFGSKMNIAYLFPAPYMAIQNIGGANDNLQMGILLEFKPFSGFKWAADFFVDDIELNDVVKLHFDTKIRMAAQTGVIFAPSDSLCTLMSLNYIAVMPYTYAHWEYEYSNSGYITGSSWNYQNYTNAGVNIGSSLSPNSDKVSFRIKIKPIRNLTFDVGANFIRHANSAESFGEQEALRYMVSDKGTYVTDGSAYMHQMFSNPASSAGTHVDSAWEKLGFMTSPHKMYVYQGIINGEFAFPKTKAGQISLKVGYTFEYIKNAGINSNVYPGGLSVEGLKSVSYDGMTGLYTVTQTDGTEKSYIWQQLKYSDDYIYKIKPSIKAAKKEWVKNLYDLTNNYISLGVKIAY